MRSVCIASHGKCLRCYRSLCRATSSQRWVIQDVHSSVLLSSGHVHFRTSFGANVAGAELLPVCKALALPPNPYTSKALTTLQYVHIILETSNTLISLIDSNVLARAMLVLPVLSMSLDGMRSLDNSSLSQVSPHRAPAQSFHYVLPLSRVTRPSYCSKHISPNTVFQRVPCSPANSQPLSWVFRAVSAEAHPHILQQSSPGTHWFHIGHWIRYARLQSRAEGAGTGTRDVTLPCRQPLSASSRR